MAVDDKTIVLKCVAGGIGCGVAGFLTNPFDVIKIKNQQFGGETYGTFMGTARHLASQEGFGAFFKGATASVLRELTYSSFRMGMYDPIKSVVSKSTGSSADSPVVKWSSAFLSGAIGSALFVPIDLVKIRFQSVLPGQVRPYRSILHALATIYKEENGFSGLYNGTAPTVVRAAFLTCAQLGSYDIIKNNLLHEKLGMEKDAMKTHFAASLVASIITTTAANPADVVKTRSMNDSCLSRSGGSKAIFHFRSVISDHGPLGFMKGWTASYLRIGPHTILSLIVIEKVRILFGIGTY